MKHLDAFTRQYLETALWAEVDTEGRPLDDGWTIHDFAPEAIARAKEECQAFQNLAGELLAGFDLGTAGHDFWLTRNRHGAGFRDGDYGKEIGEKLTELSHKFRELHIYKNEAGKLCFE